MDIEPLPSGYLEAGQDYGSALKRLGLDPQGLLWALDFTISEFVLVLITQHFDIKGPTEIFRLLNLAYAEAKTPANIDPFIIRLHSLDQLPALEIGNYLRIWGKEADIPIDFVTAKDLRFLPSWVISFRVEVDPPDRLQREWDAFRKAVEAAT